MCHLKLLDASFKHGLPSLWTCFRSAPFRMWRRWFGAPHAMVNTKSTSKHVIGGLLLTEVATVAMVLDTDYIHWYEEKRMQGNKMTCNQITCNRIIVDWNWYNWSSQVLEIGIAKKKWPANCEPNLVHPCFWPFPQQTPSFPTKSWTTFPLCSDSLQMASKLITMDHEYHFYLALQDNWSHLKDLQAQDKLREKWEKSDTSGRQMRKRWMTSENRRW